MAAEAFVSTGVLPDPERVQALVDEAHTRFRSNDEGALSAVYPALQQASPDDFGLCVVAVTGRALRGGAADVAHSIMSVAKPFVFALVCDELGPDEATRRVGANATGLPFNAPEAIVRSADGRTNPMVNPGAITTTSYIPGATPEARWTTMLDGLSAFAGRPLALDEEIYASATATNTKNRKLASLLEERRLLGCDRDDGARPLHPAELARGHCPRPAVMGATLADGGVNPVTGRRGRERRGLPSHARRDGDGRALRDVGGLAGRASACRARAESAAAMVTVSPGKGALGTFAPLLDDAGNSVKGQLAAVFRRVRSGWTCSPRRPRSPSGLRADRRRQRKRGCSLGACVVACRSSPAFGRVTATRSCCTAARVALLRHRRPGGDVGRVLRDAVLAGTVVVAYWTATARRAFLIPRVIVPSIALVLVVVGAVEGATTQAARRPSERC